MSTLENWYEDRGGTVILVPQDASSVYVPDALLPRLTAWLIEHQGLTTYPPEGFQTVDARVEEARREVAALREANDILTRKVEDNDVEVDALQQELLNLYRHLYTIDPR